MKGGRDRRRHHPETGESQSAGETDEKKDRDRRRADEKGERNKS
jgi:hypothetical protein